MKTNSLWHKSIVTEEPKCTEILKKPKILEKTTAEEDKVNQRIAKRL